MRRRRIDEIDRDPIGHIVGCRVSEPVGASPTNWPVPSITVNLPPRVSPSSGEPPNRLAVRIGRVSRLSRRLRRKYHAAAVSWLSVVWQAERPSANETTTIHNRSYGHAAARQ